MKRKTYHCHSLLFAMLLSLSGMLWFGCEYSQDGLYVNIPVSEHKNDLTAPENLKISHRTARTITLKWDDKSTQEGAYEISRAETAEGPWKRHAVLSKNSESYTDTAVEPGTRYWYYVDVVEEGGGLHLSSNTVSGTTGDLLYMLADSPFSSGGDNVSVYEIDTINNTISLVSTIQEEFFQEIDSVIPEKGIVFTKGDDLDQMNIFQLDARDNSFVSVSRVQWYDIAPAISPDLTKAYVSHHYPDDKLGAYTFDAELGLLHEVQLMDLPYSVGMYPMHPAGKYLYCVANGTNFLKYMVNQADGTLSGPETLSIPAYDHIYYSRDGHYVYFIEDDEYILHAYAYDNISGDLTWLYDKISSVVSAAMHPHKDIAYIMEGNVVHCYNIASDGTLQEFSSIASWTATKGMKIDPGGEILVLPYTSQNRLQLYKVNPDNGKLSHLRTISGPDPATEIYFLRLSGYKKFEGDWDWQLSNIPNDALIPTAEIDSEDDLHIVYSGDSSAHGYWSLFYGQYALGTNSWNLNDISYTDDDGREVDMAIADDDSIHICHCNDSDDQLYYTHNRLGGWHTQSVLSINWPIGNTRIRTRNSSVVHIIYVDNDSVYYNTNLSGSWQSEIIPGIIPRSKGDFEIDSNDKVHLVIPVDDTYLNLKYCTNQNGFWEFNDIEVVGYLPRVAFDSTDKLHIVYHSGIDSRIKYATYNGSSWEKTDIDQTYGYGGNISLDISGNDQVHIEFADPVYFYSKYMTFSDEKWHRYYIPAGKDLHMERQMRVDSDGYIHTVYFDYTDKAMYLTNRP